MADNIKVNSTEWNTLTKDDQERVKNILAVTGLLKGGISITPDPSVKASAAGLSGGGFQPAASFCKIGCDIAEAAAVAACAATPAPQLCINAVHAAADICRQNC